jgi:hypothetical protein
MIVDLSDKDVAGKFELKGGGKVHLRLRNEKDEREILAACRTVTAEYPFLDGQYRRFEVVKNDQDLFFEMSMDRNITGWDGLFDKNKKPIPVTKENKVLLMKVAPDFRDAVNAGLAALKEAETAEAKIAEHAEKNSLPLLPGEPASGG